MNHIGAFAQRVERAARRVDLMWVRRPELEAREFRGGNRGSELQGSLLPIEVVGAMVGSVPLVLAALPDVPNAQSVSEVVRRVRNQSVVARSYLKPEQATDLQIWLTGPPASDDEREWHAVAIAIERDERVARKMVWLPPAAGDRQDASFLGFIARTFLARPWHVAQQPHAQLDRLSSLVSVASDLEIDGAVLKQWFQLAEATDDVESGAELVDQLISAWKDPQG